MSVLPAGQTLRQLLPDAEELLRDPAPYLRAEPVIFGPRQMYQLAGLFGIAALGCVLYSVWQGEFDPEAVALGVGLGLGALVWLSWSLLMRGHELTLLPDGIALRYRDTVVVCPWSLFNTGGTPFVPDADNPRSGLIVPVAAEAMPYVVLRRHEAPVAHGVEVAARQFYFTAGNEAVFPARYELRANELGWLLLQLGARLGHTLPKEAPPPEAYRTDDLELDRLAESGDPRQAPPSEWLTVPLTQLAFPPCCCSCQTETRSLMNFHAAARFDWLQNVFTQAMHGTVVPIPVCPSCQEELRRQEQQAVALWMPLGAGALVALAWALAWLVQINDWHSLLYLGLGAGTVGALLGFLVGARFGRRLPVQVRHCSPTHGTVALRFDNPNYGAAVRDLLHERMRAARQHRHR